VSGSTPLGTPDTPNAAVEPKPAWWLWLLLGAALVVITLIIVLVAIQLPSGGTSPVGSPGPTGTPSPRDTAEPSGDPTPVPQATANPIPIDEPGTIEPGVTASIDTIEAVQGEAKGPGEVAGPAIRFRVSISNTTSAAIDLGATVVTVDYGTDRTPALELFEPGASPLPSSVDPGATATAVYIFTVPVDQRGLVHITVDYTVGVAPLEFTGPVPAS
jgi:hypothetical protein